MIPYFIMLIAEGMPLLYLELAVGQRMRQGSIGAWKMISPYLCGVGGCSVLVSGLSTWGTRGVWNGELCPSEKDPGGLWGFTGSHWAE